MPTPTILPDPPVPDNDHDVDRNGIGTTIRLPADVQEGGVVESALRENGRRLNGQQQYSLQRQVLELLGGIRKDLAASSDGQSLESDRYAEALKQAKASADPVFLYCLSRRAGLDDLSRSLEDAAWQKHLQHPSDYQAVLGELVPEDLRRAIEERLAEDAYRQGSNQTALEHWHVFARLLANHPVGENAFLPGLPTGVPGLDHAIGGVNGLVFISGDKGVGKTTLTLQMSVSALRGDPDLAVLFYSLDMDKTRLLERLLCHESGVDYRTLRAGKREEKTREALKAAIGRLKRDVLPRLRFVEREFPPRHDSVFFFALTEDSNRLLRSTRCAKLLVVIDLFQRIPVPDGTLVSPGPVEGTSRSKLLTDLDKDHFRLDSIKRYRHTFRTDYQPEGPPVIAISEIRKSESSSRGRPSRDDLLGSGRLASDADTVLIMWPTKENEDAAATIPTTLRIDKARDGGIRTAIPLLFRHTQSRFEEVSERPKTAETGAALSRSCSAKIDPLAGGR